MENTPGRLHGTHHRNHHDETTHRNDTRGRIRNPVRRTRHGNIHNHSGHGEFVHPRKTIRNTPGKDINTPGKIKPQ